MQSEKSNKSTHHKKGFESFRKHKSANPRGKEQGARSEDRKHSGRSYESKNFGQRDSAKGRDGKKFAEGRKFDGKGKFGEKKFDKNRGNGFKKFDRPQKPWQKKEEAVVAEPIVVDFEVKQNQENAQTLPTGLIEEKRLNKEGKEHYHDINYNDPIAVARLVTVQALYSYLHHGDKVEPLNILQGVLSYHSGEEDKVKLDIDYFRDLFYGVLNRQDYIDEYLKKYLTRDISKIGFVEISILRVGAYEILTLAEAIPAQVINSAVSLAHSIGANGSYSLINSCLDKLYKLEREQALQNSENLTLDLSSDEEDVL